MFASSCRDEAQFDFFCGVGVNYVFAHMMGFKAQTGQIARNHAVISVLYCKNLPEIPVDSLRSWPAHTPKYNNKVMTQQQLTAQSVQHITYKRCGSHDSELDDSKTSLEALL